MPDQVAQLMSLYPRIYFACHTRHVPDHLDEIEPTGLLTLAAHMGVTASTMSLMIDRLARNGYVIRERDVKDGRRVGLRLTKAGVRIKSEKSVLDPARVKAVLNQLTVAERSKAIQGLALLAKASAQAMQCRAVWQPATSGGFDQ